MCMYRISVLRLCLLRRKCRPRAPLVVKLIREVLAGARGNLADQFHDQRRPRPAFSAQQAQSQYGDPIHAHIECWPGDSESRYQHGSIAFGLWTVQSKGMTWDENVDYHFCVSWSGLIACGNYCCPCCSSCNESACR